MKKFIMKGLLAIAMFFSVASVASAQSLPLVPVDTAVRIGKLDNGLTYYIRHNETPKGQADFFIAQKVGSILEDESQRGLAHFLEHMCFNGTKNFPGNNLIDWCETVGVKFGQNLNAYTGFDETVYNISSVPTARTGVQDSCLLILHDWADALILDPKEIDKERGVIHQEWRRSMQGQMRILENLLPKVYPGSKYGVRLPIGLMDVVDNFPPQVLRDYYEKWYRPDQQGIIVVGDIDPDYIEGKIKEIFSDIQMPANAAERVYEPVPDTPGTIYAIGSDKEMNLPVAFLFFKSKERLLPEEMRPTMAFFAVNYMTSMVQTMLNNRLDEIAQKPDAPFAGASIEIGDFFISKTKDALQLQVIPKGDNFDAAIKAAYGEVLRAARNGFTVGEYERAKSQYLATMEKAAAQADKTDNTKLAREYVRNFADAEPIPGAKLEYEFAKQFSMVPLEQLNKLLPELVQDTDNRVVLVMMPEAEGFAMPTEAALAATIANAEAAEYEAYTDQMKAEPLIPNLPAAMKPVKVEKDAKFDTTVLKYANGMTVIVKQTDHKANEIRLNGMAKGGFSTVDPSQANNVQFLPYSMSNHGLGDYTALDLQKYMQGKQSSLNISIDDYTVQLVGNTTPKDLKTLMELIYMNLTDFEITEEEFAATQAQFASVLANQENNPQYIFGKELYKSLYTSPLKQAISVDAIKGADRQGTLDIIHSMLAHPSRFTLVFVGDINMDEFMPLADQYLGSIRADRSMPVPFVTNPAVEPALGSATTTKTTKMETPQTWVAITAGATIPFTTKNRLLSSVAAQILSNRLLKTIREDMGAVYSIGAAGSMSRVDKQNAALQIPFPMKPEMKDEVLTAIKGMLNDMTLDVKDEELAPIKEFMVKEVIKNLEDNADLAATLSAITLNGVDTMTDAQATINALTTDDVKNYMKALLGADNLRIFVLDPAE